MTMTPLVIHDAVQFENFSVLDFEQPAGMRVPSHFHEATTVLCVLEGNAVDRIGSHSYSVSAGSILVRPAGAVHTHDYRATLRALAISIEEASADGMRIPQRAAVTIVSPVVRGLSEELRHRDVLRPMGVSAAVAEIAALFARDDVGHVRNAPPAWLVRVRELLHDESAERLSLGNAAAVAGVHPGHLARAFRAHFGVSLTVYSRAIRLRRAARALILSSSTVAEIAVRHGFCDQSHFDRLFRRSFGFSPSSFRVMFGLSKPTHSRPDTIV
jgi:AraC family transcriptional regulator